MSGFHGEHQRASVDTQGTHRSSRPHHACAALSCLRRRLSRSLWLLHLHKKGQLSVTSWRTNSPILLLAVLSSLLASRDLHASDQTCPSLESVGGIGGGLEAVGSGFEYPVYVTSPPGQPDRLFVVEQRGLIRQIHGQGYAQPFLDIRDRVDFDGGERGLLGLAFHPSFAANGRLFVHYTNHDGDIVISEFLAGQENPSEASSDSERRLLVIPHRASPNHNGGQVAFGPDGYLYIGTGDGSWQEDLDNNGQNVGTLLGKLLRIDVDSHGPGIEYAVPESNPFVGRANAAPEIWAFGLRNPWRFSFDRETGDLYIGDVGQYSWEEVNVKPAGAPGGVNYGWSYMEGSRCFRPAEGCPTKGLTLPVLEYPNRRDEAVEGKGHWGIPSAIVGGYVYRGSQIPALRGTYLYADYFLGFVRTFVLAHGQATCLRDITAELIGQAHNQRYYFSSFGEDANGELYIVEHRRGEIYRIVPRKSAPPP